ncbi:hypothetical protein, partial [Shinella sp.]|uniref:hypothetical protein n=1 Tax=Shinella sp. TaxID=1870904 RepID=UPI00289A1055
RHFGEAGTIGIAGQGSARSPGRKSLAFHRAKAKRPAGPLPNKANGRAAKEFNKLLQINAIRVASAAGERRAFPAWRKHARNAPAIHERSNHGDPAHPSFS